MEDAMSNVSTSISSAANRSAQQEAKTPADLAFEEEVGYVNGLEQQVTNVAKHTSLLIRRQRETANGLFEFGLAFTLLGQSETGGLGTALTQMGHSADRLSCLSAEEAEKEALNFEEPLNDYIRIVGAAKAALNQRTTAKSRYHS